MPFLENADVMYLLYICIGFSVLHVKILKGYLNVGKRLLTACNSARADLNNTCLFNPTANFLSNAPMLKGVQ
jgi:hypothetical protein